MAEAWDLHERRLAEHTAPVRAWLLAQLNPLPGETILELAAGTGGLSRAAATAVGPDGAVLCTDLAPGMVDAARRRASDDGLGNVRCSVMDAQDLDLPADSVDGIVCAFGFMLMPDTPRALAEARRVLRPDGRLVASTWGPAEHNPWLLLLAGALLQHGHAAQTDPTGPGGVFSLSDPDVVTAAFDAAAFGDVTVVPVDLTQRFDTFDDFWDFHAATGGPVAAVLNRLEAQEVAQIRTTCREFSEPFATGEGYAFPGRALVAIAV